LKLYFTIKNIARKVNEDKIGAYAAETSFFITICIFPFIIFVFTILQYTPVSEETFLKLLLAIMPEQVAPLMISIVEEIYSRSSVALISITAIIALWISGKAFIGIIDGLNSIYGIRETRNYIFRRIYAAVCTLLFVFVMVAMLLFLVFGKYIIQVTGDIFPIFTLLASELLKRKFLIMQCVLTLFFMLLYKFIPNRRCSMIIELPGALFASVGWQLFSYIYSLYIKLTPGFTATYGSLATIVFAMLWLYFCIYIVFFGAEINTLLDKKALYLPFLQNIKKTNK
jgi:membrane protein